MGNCNNVKKDFQFGRSMLEILAVIAIICILSIGTIEIFYRTVSSQEADRISEDVKMLAMSFQGKGTALRNKGIADTQLVREKTRSGRDLAVVSDCPKGAITIKVKEIDRRTCEYLMKKDWEKPAEPLFFYRAQSFEDVCQSGEWTETSGYYMTGAEDCERLSVSGKVAFAVAFDFRNRAKKVKTCKGKSDCLSCQKCNTDKQLCVDDCGPGQICSRTKEVCEEELHCNPGEYPNQDAGKCDPCPADVCDVDGLDDKPECDAYTNLVNCEEGKYCNQTTQKCVSCPEPTTTICSGTPEKDSNECPTEKLEACTDGKVCKDRTTCVGCLSNANCTSPGAPVCNMADNTCGCPEHATCPDPNDPNNPFTCDPGYYKDGDECKLCSTTPTESCLISTDVVDETTGCTTQKAITCSENQSCTASGACRSCAAPTESCLITEDVVDGTTGCITQKAVTCTVGEQFCNSTGSCSNCPAITSSRRSCKISQDEIYTDGSGYPGCIKTQAFTCSGETPICAFNGNSCVDTCDDNRKQFVESNGHCCRKSGGNPYWNSETGACGPCPTPTENCMIKEDIKDDDGICVVQEVVTCSGNTPLCDGNGICVSTCPAGTVESNGHCCPPNAPWSSSKFSCACTYTNQCGEGQYCDKTNGVCQNCPTDPVENCMIENDIKDENGCITQKTTKCSGETPLCRTDNGECVSMCPSGMIGNDGHCCPLSNPVWEDGLCQGCWENSQCGENGYCDGGACVICEEPTPNCMISEAMLDPSTGCTTQQPTTCSGITPLCISSSGECVSICPNGMTPSNGHCCPDETPVWNQQTQSCDCAQSGWSKIWQYADVDSSWVCETSKAGTKQFNYCTIPCLPGGGYGNDYFCDVGVEDICFYNGHPMDLNSTNVKYNDGRRGILRKVSDIRRTNIPVPGVGTLVHANENMNFNTMKSYCESIGGFRLLEYAHEVSPRNNPCSNELDSSEYIDSTTCVVKNPEMIAILEAAGVGGVTNTGIIEYCEIYSGVNDAYAAYYSRGENNQFYYHRNYNNEHTYRCGFYDKYPAYCVIPN